MSKDTAYLFVYGTLRRGSNNEFSRLLSTQAQFLGPARMQGKLYRIGWHPSAEPSDDPSETVHGEVFRLADPGNLLSVLDEYEGLEFHRAVLPVVLDSGLRFEAWVYLYRGPKTGTRIASGEWSEEV